MSKVFSTLGYQSNSLNNQKESDLVHRVSDKFTEGDRIILNVITLGACIPGVNVIAGIAKIIFALSHEVSKDETQAALDQAFLDALLITGICEIIGYPFTLGAHIAGSIYHAAGAGEPQEA